jgi:hypothetical protein
VREIVSLTGLDFDGNAPETVVEKRISFDSSVSGGGGGGEKIDGVIGNDVLENRGVEGDKEGERIGGEEKSSMVEEDEEEEEVVSDAVARLINDVSPTLTHIDDLPGKKSILNTLNIILCYAKLYHVHVN